MKRISTHQWRHIVKAGVWRPGCPVTRRSLRRVEVNHFTFSGQIERGTLIVNADVASSVARIFTRLFEAHFPIRRMRPVEVYDGDSDASLRADTPLRSTAGAVPNQRSADEVSPRQWSRHRYQPTREPLEEPSLQVLVA